MLPVAERDPACRRRCWFGFDAKAQSQHASHAVALTALAAMVGALFILDDPIFNGLAVSLIFGIFVSTLLTLVVIPVLYYAYLRRRAARPDATAAVAPSDKALTAPGA